ncbi:hypothetical protein [Marinibactrum halimedae]|uniref:GLUG domain-containing protein n=1 Tax=Marinibactrum halimedae TaxID=1444977 RepID=A0AA37WN84_9GAMM|nr:hypothetical protein [Marinibactrum halimedae]MCD9459111.1 hypothetical protein [Marinibactrum halimedae]GLS24712.1 hypothetical protein GCM10007877_04260 [Marinibactrum halimedae]
MIIFSRNTLISCLLLSASSYVSANPESIVDQDGNGLIEIDSLETLNWIRNDLSGEALVDFHGNRSSQGCPNSGCFGYELTADLSFDTSGDGKIDADDAYFDYDGDGSNNGWLPIGNDTAGFEAVFNGNGHTISGLYINRDQTDIETQGNNIGLFGSFQNHTYDGRDRSAYISNITIEIAEQGITGYSNVGTIVGNMYFDNYPFFLGITFDNIFINGDVRGNNHVGGILGAHQDDGDNNSGVKLSFIKNNFNGTIESTSNFAGGLVGNVDVWAYYGNVVVENNLISGSVTSSGSASLGGIIGNAEIREAFSTIQNNNVNITLSANTGSAGGIAAFILGEYGGAKVNSNTVRGEISTNGSYLGGLVGDAYEAEGWFDAQGNKIYATISGGSRCTGGVAGSLLSTSDFSGNMNILENTIYGDVTGNRIANGVAGCTAAFSDFPDPIIIEDNVVIGTVTAAQ